MATLSGTETELMPGVMSNCEKMLATVEAVIADVEMSVEVLVVLEKAVEVVSETGMMDTESLPMTDVTGGGGVGCE